MPAGWRARRSGHASPPARLRGGMMHDLRPFRTFSGRQLPRLPVTCGSAIPGREYVTFPLMYNLEWCSTPFM
jgi:hypothetical protein